MITQQELKVLTRLRSLEQTRDLETSHLKKLASMASQVEFAKDELIYRQGVETRAIYIIEEGEIVIEMETPNSGVIVVNRIGPGGWFGLSSLFSVEERGNKTAKAKVPTRAIAIDAEKLQHALKTDQAFDGAVIRFANKIMIDRIRETREQLIGLLTT
jgi:CRP-like cAMP-binding protein